MHHQAITFFIANADTSIGWWLPFFFFAMLFSNIMNLKALFQFQIPPTDTDNPLNSLRATHRHNLFDFVMLTLLPWCLATSEKLFVDSPWFIPLLIALMIQLVIALIAISLTLIKLKREGFQSEWNQTYARWGPISLASILLLIFSPLILYILYLQLGSDVLIDYLFEFIKAIPLTLISFLIIWFYFFGARKLALANNESKYPPIIKFTSKLYWSILILLFATWWFFAYITIKWIFFA